MKWFDTARRAECEGPTLSPEFIRQTLKLPPAGPHAIANASQAALSLEADRDCIVTDVRVERMRALLIECLPYVRESCQGRGDPELEKLIVEELHHG